MLAAISFKIGSVFPISFLRAHFIIHWEQSHSSVPQPHLRRILTGCDENGADEVGGMRIEAAHRPSDRGPGEVLRPAQLSQLLGLQLQQVPQHRARQPALREDGLAAAQHPVDGGRLLIGARVAAQADQLRLGEALGQTEQGTLTALANHVHAHGVAGLRCEAKMEITAGL